MNPGIAVLLTCFNRREQTLACIDRLRHQAGLNRPLDVFLVDDGSTDGTADAVRAAYPDVTVVRSEGDLYWCRGMATAWRSAVESGGSFSHYLMLNDDTILDENAVQSLLAAERDSPDRPAIVVGQIEDPASHRITYGALVRTPDRNPLALALREPGDFRPIVAMNGNCVLVPAAVVDRIGFVDPVFHHRFGDIDLGLRAVEAGLALVATEESVGTCARNPHSQANRHALTLSLAGWIRHLLSPKGLEPRDWWVFTRRHGGKYWFLYWGRAYLVGVLRWPYARAEAGVASLWPRSRPT